MNNVLITGASGFVGRNILEYLLDNTDWHFTCIRSLAHANDPSENTDRVKYIDYDLRFPMRDYGYFDFILNLASLSSVEESIDTPVRFIISNVEMTLSVLEYARRYPPKVFLQFSTEEVYGATNHKEWDVQLPSNPYAASKSAQEMIAIAYWRTYKIPVVITNSSNIVGKGQNRDKFVPKVIDKINKGEVVQIYTTNGIPGKRYWNPVENVADAIKFILHLVPAHHKGPRPDRFDLPGGEQLDNLQMAKLIGEIMQKPLKYELIDAQEVRPGYNEFFTKAKGELIELGWQPVKTLREGLSWI